MEIQEYHSGQSQDRAVICDAADKLLRSQSRVSALLAYAKQCCAHLGLTRKCLDEEVLQIAILAALRQEEPWDPSQHSFDAFLRLHMRQTVLRWSRRSIENAPQSDIEGLDQVSANAPDPDTVQRNVETLKVLARREIYLVSLPKIKALIEGVDDLIATHCRPN